MDSTTGAGVDMDPLQCAAVFGRAAGPVCQRAMALGWKASDGAGWLSTLSAVIAGFIFAAIVMVLAPQSGQPRGDQERMEVGHSLPLLIGAFLSLLVASLLLVLVSSQLHPLRIGLAASVATAVFAVGAVQTFVAIAWLFLLSPRSVGAFGSVRLVVRFVMFFGALHLYTTVWKAQTTTTGDHWTATLFVLAAVLLAGPWLLSRLLVRPGYLVHRFNGAFQVFTTRCAVAFLGLAAVAMVYADDRPVHTAASAFPGWLAAAILLGAGLLVALFDLNLPPAADAPRSAEGAARTLVAQLSGVGS